MKASVAYRILSLELRGTKKRVGFNGALLRHMPGGRLVEITNLRTPMAKVKAYLDQVGQHEVATIRYQIIATDPITGDRLSAPVSFCHPFPRGTGVKLKLSGGTLVMVRDGNGRFFSDDFWLHERLADKRLPRQAVYQFHE